MVEAEGVADGAVAAAVIGTETLAQSKRFIPTATFRTLVAGIRYRALCAPMPCPRLHRHREERGDAAIQSTRPPRKPSGASSGLLRRFAPRNDEKSRAPV